MPRINTSRRLYATLGSMVKLPLVLALIAGLTFQGMAEADERNEHSHRVISAVQHLLTSMVDMETGARGYMLTGRKEFLTPFEKGRVNFRKRYREALTLTSDNPDYQQLLTQLHQQ